ncbi:Conserved_hypothetical protein [Hexamita inflata]|uniref:Uncharacterized protein n=1 Tax=Hexamita inflata TaxID=28002 RepID=A0ABP1KKZ0_9EUKA
MPQPKFTQSQFIDFYLIFLQYIQPQQQDAALITSEIKMLYGPSQTNLNLLLSRLMNSGTDQPVVEAGLVLFFRILSVHGLNSLTQFNCHRLITSSLILANITFEDDTLLLTRWQRMTNYVWSLPEMRYMVIEMLASIRFKLIVEQEEINHLWQLVLLPFYNHSLLQSDIEQFISEQRELVLEIKD